MSKYFILIEHTSYVPKNKLAAELQRSFLMLNKTITSDKAATISQLRLRSSQAHADHRRCKDILFTSSHEPPNSTIHADAWEVIGVLWLQNSSRSERRYPMVNMTKELFEKGTKFISRNYSCLKFHYKPSEAGAMILMSTSHTDSPVFFANISKVDRKGFNYYTYNLIGKTGRKGLSARVNFSDLIPLIEKEVSNV